MSPLISHHLLLCVSPQKQLCCPSKEGIKSWQRLKDVLKELNLEDPNRPEGVVLRSRVDCLRICNSGPILLIWPEGIWYKKVSPDRIDLIVREHIIRSSKISKWILKETPLRRPIKI